MLQNELSPIDIDQQSIQTETVSDEYGLGHVVTLLSRIQSGEDLIPPYWSATRDLKLVEFGREVDHLKIAINTFVSKAINIPLLIYPFNASMTRHLEIAESMRTRLIHNSERLKGFEVAYKKFLFDYLTTDNGAFLYIYGDESPEFPLQGFAYGVEHLPSFRCTRTSNPEFPVVYTSELGKRYRVHFTRVIELSNLPCPDPRMNGVGMCPISLCLSSARELDDIQVYSQEKFGSRPQRQILYVRTGATVNQLAAAIGDMDAKLDSTGLTRFAKTGLLAPKIPGGKLELEILDLVSAPDGFNRQEVAILDMATIAASFGLDLRDLAMSFGMGGQTRSDAEVLHLKGLGKGVAEVSRLVAQQLDQKFLPEAVTCSFDFIDDSQDLQKAEIREKRTQSRTRDIMAGVATERSTRKQMLEDDEINQAAFDELELESGRLPTGVKIESLLYSSDQYIRSFLVFNVPFPQNIAGNDPTMMIFDLDTLLAAAYTEFQNVSFNEVRSGKMRQVIALLDSLKTQYQAGQQQQEQMMMGAMQPTPTPGGNGAPPKPNNLMPPQARQNGVVAGATSHGLPQPERQNGQSGGQNGNGSPFPSTPQLAKAVDRFTPSGLGTEKPSKEEIDDALLAFAVGNFNLSFPNYAGILDFVPGSWIWDAKLKSFVSQTTKQPLSEIELFRLYSLLDNTVADSIDLAVNQLADDGDVEGFGESVWNIVTDALILAWLLGAGGLGTFDEAGKKKIEETLWRQLGFFDEFLPRILRGELTLDQIRNYAKMYGGSGRALYAQARESAYVGLRLPAYPAVGTDCGSNCRCSWRIREFSDRWEAFWVRSAKESCKTCVSRSHQYSPYVQYKG